MDAQQFLAEFGHIVNAPGGVARLRELVLSMAVQGRLVPQESADEPAAKLLARIKAEKNRLILSKKIKRRAPLEAIADGEKKALLPNAWGLSRLGDIATKLTDGSHNPPKGTGVGFPMLSSQNVLDGMIDFAGPSRLLSEEDFKKENARTEVQPGDILLTIVGTLGRSAVVPADAPLFALQRSVAVIRSSLVPEYLSLLLRSPMARAYYSNHGKGTAQKGIYLAKLGDMVIPIPPLQEQSRIVAKVDELMALCDKLEAQQQQRRSLQNNLRQSTLQAVAAATSPHELQTTWTRLADNFGRLFHAQNDLLDLRQCIKKLALGGYLTSRESHEAIFSELQNSAIAASHPVTEEHQDWEIPSHWIWARTGWLGEARLGKMLDASKNKGNFVPYLRNINVRWRKFELSDVLTMRVEPHELPKISVRKGDLVICEGGEPGRAAIWNEEREFVIQKALHRFRCGADVLPEYMLLCIEHDYFSGRLSRYFTGATIKHLTGRALSEYPIPLPPITEQSRIIEKVEDLMRFCDSLEAQLRHAIELSGCLAATAVASITGIATNQEEDDPVKVPQTELIAPLRLGKAPDIKAQAPLATILARHNGEISAKDLWQRFGGEIDDFYTQLKAEVAHGWILEPGVAEMREKLTETASA